MIKPNIDRLLARHPLLAETTNCLGLIRITTKWLSPARYETSVHIAAELAEHSYSDSLDSAIAAHYDHVQKWRTPLPLLK
jgi:hypothetical protein